MLGIMAGMVSYDPLYLTVTLFGVRPWSTRLWIFLEVDFWMDSVFRASWLDSGYMCTSGHGAFMVQTAENCGVSAVAVHDGRRYPRRGAEAVSHGLAVQQTIEILLLILNTVIDVPVAQIVQVPSYMVVTCFGVRLWSTGLWTFLEDYFRMDSVFSSCWLNTGYMFTSVYGGRALLPCRDAEAFPWSRLSVGP